ncbi:MAG: hypothetical protein Q7S52_02360 [bacterium]|nr:hypothetical protein [bacterium]
MSASKYEFLEWHKLNALIRADLITMIEGVRQGAKIELWKLERISPLYFLQQKPLLEYCAEKLALSLKEHDGAYYVSRDTATLNRLWSGEIKKEGEFLGYPSCCITAFEVGCKKSMTEGPEWGPAVQFWRKMEQCSNPLFGYVLHVPCDVLCAATLATAGVVKDVLEKHDIGAAVALAEFNKNSFYEFHCRYPKK